MARNVTGAQLLASARHLADQRGGTYIRDAEGYDFLTTWHGVWYDLLLQKDPDFFPALYSVFDADGSSEYKAPAKFGYLIGIDRLEGQDWVDLDTFSIGERNRFPSGSGGPATKYRPNGEAVELRPSPSSGRYRWVYHAVTEPITEKSEVNDLFGWSRLIVYGAALDMKAKEGTDPSVLLAQQQKFEQDLYARIALRQSARPRRIRDVQQQVPDDAADVWPLRGA